MRDKIECKCSELFDSYAILRANPMPDQWSYLQEWLAEGYHGELRYMERTGRDDLRAILPGVRTVVVVAVGYAREKSAEGVARCFSGSDYHLRVKKLLYKLLDEIRIYYPDVVGRGVVDSAPAFEKAWAVRGGLGWRGRNSLVVNRDFGSYFNIGLLLVDTELPEVIAQGANSSGCGNCRRCIDSCPRGAVKEDFTIDARRCISYLNMEHPRLSGKPLVEPIDGWVKGCDLCQECCPWNK